MNKVFVVMKRSLSVADEATPVAVFESEADAVISASKHKDLNHRAWAEEVNYFKKEE